VSLLSVDTPLRGIGLLVLATILFSLSDAMAKYLSQSLPVTEIAWLRYVAFVVLAVWLDVRSGAGRFRVRRPGLQVLRGLALVGSAISIMMALRRMPLAETSAVSYVSPALITILSIPMLGEVVRCGVGQRWWWADRRAGGGAARHRGIPSRGPVCRAVRAVLGDGGAY